MQANDFPAAKGTTVKTRHHCRLVFKPRNPEDTVVLRCLSSAGRSLVTATTRKRIRI